ncbi:flagellar hook-associated protein FlgK [Sporomusa malonica]|uniref:Flagellar hook-associated protein 1 n=1 Tax=Sporomusa malonica TaxID=112901 RepID=A0A1W2DF44_9FIRM|nr:flagellar hook-associated protein FlgK [Sporomusa malonica]SMC96169.1 flagellar hook-associated protein 1 FlgK [Sporomusa malonica]
MMSTFLGLTIATRGLYASQASLGVASHNLSNVNTPGYSRQSPMQQAAGPAAVYNGRSRLGIGTQVDTVLRIRDLRLDQKYWQENDSLGEWESKQGILNEIELVLGEPSSNAFNTTFDQFYSSMEALSKAAGDSSPRTNFRQAASSLCEYFNNSAERFKQMRQDTNGEVRVAVDEINSYSKQIAELNQRIRQTTLAGAAANDLEDQRDLLIDKLSKLAKIEVSVTVADTMPDGSELKTLSISINGSTLVNDNKARSLECYQIADGGSKDGMYGIRWQDTADEFDPGGGSLQSYLELRDGSGLGSQFKGIPYYQNQLDEFARTFAKAFNEGVLKDGTAAYPGHAGGQGLDGSTQIRFFSFNHESSADLMASGSDQDEIYSHITAGSLTLSSDVENDINKIAAASATGGNGNNENVQQLIKLCKDSNLFNKGTPEDFMNSIIAALATDSSHAQNTADRQGRMIKTVDGWRASVSGVSENEETSNFARYQQAYAASGKIISVWDEIYKETINLISG